MPDNVQELLLKDEEIPGVVIDRFPSEDYPDCPLNDGLPLVRCVVCAVTPRFGAIPLRLPHCAQFCFPEGIKTVSSAHPKAALHTHGSFVLTDSNGASSYGYSLQFYEPIKSLPSAFPCIAAKLLLALTRCDDCVQRWRPKSSSFSHSTLTHPCFAPFSGPLA